MPFKPVTNDDPYRDSPWPENGVLWLHVDPEVVKEFEAVVETATSEAPIHAFLERNPVLLSQILGGGHGRWIFSKSRLGAEHVPDFMLCEKDSGGYHWTLLELENPHFPPLTQSGEQSAKLTHAIQQVRDWRIWLRKNIQYAQQELGFVDLDSDFQGIVVIGRRRSLNDEHRERYRELSNGRITVMSFDRLLDMVRGAAAIHSALIQELTRPDPLPPTI
jgi:hypothetical protein